MLASMRPTRRRGSEPVPRKQPTQERAAATVDAILGAVERVLEKHGAAGLTTNRVAEVAGVSVGTLYQYYPNKEALVGAVIERYYQQTFAMCRAALAAGAGVPIGTIVDRVAEALAAAYQVQRPIHRWLIDLRSAAAYQERFRTGLDELVEEITRFLEARPDVRFPDPRAAAFLLVHGIEGIIAAAGARSQHLDVPELTREGARMVRAYLDAHSKS
jgi:AcrR family transcriptional regulator